MWLLSITYNYISSPLCDELIEIKKDWNSETDSNSYLTDEAELEKFNRCLKEYQDHCMTITPKQFEYIREEICADYFAKE